MAQQVIAHHDQRKPLLTTWMGGEQIAAAEHMLNQANIPTLPYPDTAARMFGNMWRYTDNLRLLYETPTLADQPQDVADAHAASEQILRRVADEGGTRLDGGEVAFLLAAYGITTALDGPTGDGLSVAIHADIDPQFGPVLRCGAGGALKHVFDDVAVALPPLNTTLTRRMLERTRVYAAFDPALLEDVLVRFSRLVVEQRRVRQIVLDPVVVRGDRVVVERAEVHLHDQSIADADLPRTAIRPYPVQYSAPGTLKDGTPITIRPIRAEDEPLMVAFHHTLSESTVYTRYFHQLQLDLRIAHERLTRICFIDYDREMALVAERDDPVRGRAILGVGRLSKLRGTTEAEFAILIAGSVPAAGTWYGVIAASGGDWAR